MHFALVKINPPDSIPSHSFDDAMLPVFHALRRLGFQTEIRLNEPNPRARNIVFGSCIAPRRVGRLLPRGSIIYNLEQMNDGSLWKNKDYLTHLRDFTVWDYSPRNCASLREEGVTDIVHVPAGYVPEMTRLRGDFPRDIDVLFYGVVNSRRKQALDALKAVGLKVEVPPMGTFGDARDLLIARARVVLNVHYYLPSTLEVFRLGYLWANKKAVVSELREDTEMDSGLADACAFCSLEDLAPRVTTLLSRPGALKEREDAGFKVFSRFPLTKILEKIVGRRAFAVSGEGGAKNAPEPWVIEG